MAYGFSRFLLLSLLSVALLAGNARAMSLGLTPISPDIDSDGIQVSYDASSNMLTANGDSLRLDAAFLDVLGTFSLAAEIDESGNLINGSLTITGKIGSFNSGTLISGNLNGGAAAFGFPPAGGDPFEFVFNVTGGDLATQFGSTGGVILSFTNFGGSFQTSFQNAALGRADTFSVPVPEPASLLLALAGFAAVAILRSSRAVAINR